MARLLPSEMIDEHSLDESSTIIGKRHNTSYENPLYHQQQSSRRRSQLETEDSMMGDPLTGREHYPGGGVRLKQLEFIPPRSFLP